jgi:peptidoglycan/LPS O-acetylase OafA/YrhL
VALLFAFNQLGGYPSYGWWSMIWPTVEGLGWAAIIVGSINSPYKMPDLIGMPLKFIAKISFSVYLLHSTVLQIAGSHKFYISLFHSVFLNGLVNGVVCLPFILMFSYVTFMAVERPFLQMRVKYVD